MIAKEMFEKLCFKLVEDSMDEIVYVNEVVIDLYTTYVGSISFDLKNKCYETSVRIEDDYRAIPRFNGMNISLKLHKAITQQMVELGWLDE